MGGRRGARSAHTTGTWLPAGLSPHLNTGTQRGSSDARQSWTSTSSLSYTQQHSHILPSGWKRRLILGQQATHDTHTYTRHTQACTIHTRDTHNTDVHTHTRNTHRHARTYTHNTHVCAHLKGPPASYHLLYGTCPVRRSEADSGRKGDGNRRAESWPSTFSSACLMNLRRSILCFHLTANAKDG